MEIRYCFTYTDDYLEWYYCSVVKVRERRCDSAMSYVNRGEI